MAQTSFQFGSDIDAAAQAARVALPGRPGHYDELRAADGSLRPAWRQFFGRLGGGGLSDLDRRADQVARQIVDDGITYNVYSDDTGVQRAWSLDLLPFVFGADEWARIEAGVAQRARLLASIMRDIYGAQQLLSDGLLPPALVLGNPGYLRPLQGLRPPGDTFLHIVACDLARAPDGRWWVVAQRTQSPSGLGYALQNRLIVSRLFPDAFRDMQVQRLASSYRRLLDNLFRLSPRADGARAAPRIVLLTPGPYNETYFEHAYLARYLGIPLVEGSDLTVRDDQVFLKTVHGLDRVHAILRRLDDDFCDPLELRPDSSLGVPGLLQAVRAGQVLMANALGSGFLESPAINGFFPAIARRLLDAELQLPSLASWWCGEAAAWSEVRTALSDKVIKPTYPHTPERPAFEPLIGADLSGAQLAALQARIEADPDAYTLQAYLPLSQAPGWHAGRLVPRAAMVRVFAIYDGNGCWQVMPGGLTRVAGRELQVVSMQRGGASQDTWVQTNGPIDTFSMLPDPLRPEDLADKRRPVTSRAAENLFWMGRYTERAEFSVRLARVLLGVLGDDAHDAGVLLHACATLALQHSLVPTGVPSPAQSTQALSVFERTLLAGLADVEAVPGVAYSLAAMARSAEQIRDRLSTEHGRLIVGAGESFAADIACAQADGILSPDEAAAALARLATQLAAITGAQTDRMTRDDGWRLLAVGRQLERLSTMARVLHALFSDAVALREDGFDLLLALFDSTITYRALYQRRIELPPLLDLLVQDSANPRSLACVNTRLRKELAKLPGDDQEQLVALLPAAAGWPTLAALCKTDAGGRHATLLAFLAEVATATHALSDGLGARYFSHAAASFRLLAA